MNKTDAQHICENLLLEEIRYNNERNILPSENAVSERLLKRGVELKAAYDEIFEKLRGNERTLKVFFGVLLSTAAFWSPRRIQEARVARAELNNVNQQIARKALELGELVEQRSQLHNTSGFISGTHSHVCDVIESASGQNYLFEQYVQEKLAALCGQFDSKYWPSLAEFLKELAQNADNAIAEASDPVTEAATSASRSSKTDFFKAFFASLEENSATQYGLLPRGFKLSDKACASLANCALDFGVEDLVDDAYVKQLRQRMRNEAK